MGRKTNHENDEQSDVAQSTAGHNSQTRKEALCSALEQLYRLDIEIAAFLRNHVKALREEKSEIKSRLREDFQMPAALVAARYASYRLERTAEDAQDETTLDAIREMYLALPVGGMVDLVSAVERTPPAPSNGAQATA